jgi:Chalcone isomerase-like
MSCILGNQLQQVMTSDRVRYTKAALHRCLNTQLVELMERSLMVSLRKFLFILSFCAAALSAASAHAGTRIEGYDFAEQISLGGQAVKLNGVGIRAVLWLKGYVAGLYVAQPSTNAHSLMKAAGAKRVSLIMMHEADTEVFVKAVHGGIEKNLSEAQIAALDTRLQSFDAAVRGIGKVKEGDIVNLDFVPDKGLVLSFNGQTRGTPVQGKDFYEAILGIFIGDNPVDKSLKLGLLGLKKPAQPKPVDLNG